MSLCCDNAFLEGNFTSGSLDDAAGSTCEVAGFSDGSGNADLAGVSERKLYLRGLACRAENGHVRHNALGTDDVNALVASELTGLRKILLLGELIAFAKEVGKMLVCNMDVTR